MKPNGTISNAAAISLALMMAKPAASIELPKYSGFRVRAYTPDVASVVSLWITPAAKARNNAPIKATGKPTRIETDVGFAKYNTAAASTKLIGTRSFWAIIGLVAGTVPGRLMGGACGRLHKLDPQ